MNRIILEGRLDRIPESASYKEIDRAVIEWQQNKLANLLYSPSHRLRLVVAARSCEMSLELAERDGFPIPVQCEFGWTVDEPEAEKLAKELDAPLAACRAATAWVRRAENSPDDYSFLEDPILGAADYCPTEGRVG